MYLLLSDPVFIGWSEWSLSYRTSNQLVNRYLFGCPKFPLPVVSCRSPSFESGSPAGSVSREGSSSGEDIGMRSEGTR